MFDGYNPSAYERWRESDYRVDKIRQWQAERDYHAKIDRAYEKRIEDKLMRCKEND